MSSEVLTDEGMQPRVTLSVALKTKEDLYEANMPFVKDGALFIATPADYSLGTLVSLQLELMDETEIFHIDGRVVWKTPLAAQGNMTAGVGIQFTSKEAHKVHKKINAYLAGTSGSEDKTETM